MKDIKKWITITLLLTSVVLVSLMLWRICQIAYEFFAKCFSSEDIFFLPLVAGMALVLSMIIFLFYQAKCKTTETLKGEKS